MVVIIYCYICLNKYVLFSTDIFLPTPDSLLVNLNESKEVRYAHFVKVLCCLIYKWLYSETEIQCNSLLCVYIM